MPKWIALVTDQHFGARSNSQIFLDYFMKFYDNVFFPALEEYGVEEIIDLGDTFDRRKSVDFYILNQVKERYYDKLLNKNIKIHSIVGNHTAYYKNTNNVNTLDLLLSDYENVVVYREPTKTKVNGHEVLLIPWINEENKADTFKLLRNKERYCFGHLEINGFEMYSGYAHADGEFNSTLFSRIENVYSGHFHHRSKKGNIMYLGNPYHITWNDFGDQRGFHMLDLETSELVFIENPYTMFQRIEYSDRVIKLDKEHFKNTYVKVIVREKSSASKFEKFIKQLSDASPLDITIVEDDKSYDAEGEDFDIEEENIYDLCKNAVKKYTVENNITYGDKIELKVMQLLKEAELENV